MQEITENISSNMYLFANNTTLFIYFYDESEAFDVRNKDLANQLIEGED